MLFNSFQFVVFYIIVTTLYFLAPYRFRWLLLLAASCYFYMAFVPIYILILGFTIVIDYFAGLYIEKSEGRTRKLLLICSLVANVGVLCVFKYYNFINENISILTTSLGFHNQLPYLTILLPIGLSFHTFQAMSYTIEVYRGNQKAEKHFGIYSLYVMFYPQLVAGPIERPQNILHQFHEKINFSYDNMVSGLQLMLWGFVKKLVVADRISTYVNPVYNNPELHNGTSIVMATVLFGVQIYCDFSGYSDIAIGCARTMGFDLMLNFRRPFFARSIGEFWSRWHISLSTWFRDYVYIPLGGNRVSVSRQLINILIIFMISGLWHGANFTFIVWGFLHGIYSVAGRATKKYRSAVINKAGLANNVVIHALEIAFNWLLVSSAWIYFRGNSYSDTFTLIRQLKTFGAAPYLGDGVSSMAHIFLAIFLLFAVEAKQEYFPEKFHLFTNRSIFVRWSAIAVLVFCIMFFGVFNGSQFIYFQF